MSMGPDFSDGNVPQRSFGERLLGAIKLGSISASLVANFAAYRYVVWPLQGAPGDPDDADRVRSGPRP